MGENWLTPFRAALDSVRSPRPVFFRDDDAGWNNGRLFQLLDLFESHSAPIDIAVIPHADGTTSASLEQRFRAASSPIGLHQHGNTHANHEAVGRSCEFGPSRGRSHQRRDILDGKARLADLFGDIIDPFFTPPWNRCTTVTGEILREESFRVLSRDVTASPLNLPGLFEIPVTIDWLKKNNGRRLPLSSIGRQLADCVLFDKSFGIMLHHAVMDIGDFAAIGELLRTMASRGIRLQLMRDAARHKPAGVVD